MSKGYLLDTSALLALMESEPGDEQVKSILRNEKAVVPWIVLTELFYITCREQGESVAELRYAMIKQTGVHIIWQADESILVNAGKIKAAHHLSFADTIIAAYAMKYGLVLVHKDPEYKALDSQIDMEALPYRK